MIPAHGYAVAVGDMIDLRSAASTEFGAIESHISRTRLRNIAGQSRDEVCSYWRSISEREPVHVVRVTVSHNRPPARAVRAIAIEQPEVEEGEY